MERLWGAAGLTQEHRVLQRRFSLDQDADVVPALNKMEKVGVMLEALVYYQAFASAPGNTLLDAEGVDVTVKTQEHAHALIQGMLHDFGFYDAVRVEAYLSELRTFAEQYARQAAALATADYALRTTHRG